MKNTLLHTALLSSAASVVGQFAAPITARVDAAPAPTVTLQPRSDYIRSPDPSVAPTGSQVVILPTDVGNKVPESGIDIFFGPDTVKKLRTTLDEKCADGATIDCTNQLIHNINEGRQFDLAKRFISVGQFVATVMAIIVAYTIERFKRPEEEPTGVHIESSVIAQVESKTASNIVIVTASNDGFPITIPIPTSSATTTPTESATITTLTADANGHHRGDILITIPAGTADLFEQLIRQTGRCKDTPVKKRGPSGTDLTTITDVSKFILPMAAPTQLLNALALQAAQRLPELRDAAQQASLEAVQAFAATLPEFQNVAAGFRNLIAEGVWWGVYDFCVEKVNDLTELVIEDELIVEDKNDDDEEEGEECPKDAPSGINAPLCERCDGSVNNICTSGKWKGCMCLGRINPWYYPGGRDLWNQQQKVLDSLLSSKGESGPMCDDKNHLNLERNLYKGLASSFCKDFDLSKYKSKDLTNKDGGEGSWGGYSGFKFHFEWEKKNGVCSDSCEAIFGKFSGTTSCSYDSHTFASAGSVDAICGTASFKFTKGEKDDSDDAAVPAPTRDVDLGILTCGTHRDQGNPTYFTTLDSMNDAIDRFCSWAAQKARKFSSGNVSGDYGTVDLHYNNEVSDPIYVALNWRDASNCPVLDFKNDASNAKKICKARLGNAVNLCDTAANGKHWWKQGGTFFRDCVEWKIVRDKWRNGSPGKSDDYRPPKTCTKVGDCKDQCGGKEAFCTSANGPGYCSCSRT